MSLPILRPEKKMGWPYGDAIASIFNRPIYSNVDVKSYIYKVVP